MENVKPNISPLFIDYLQTWMPLDRHHFSKAFAERLASKFSGFDDGYYPPNSVQMNTNLDILYINLPSKGLNIKIRKGDVRVQFSGSFTHELTVPRQLTEYRKFFRSFFMFLEDDKEIVNRDTGLVTKRWENAQPRKEHQYYQDTKITILHLAKNVYNVNEFPLKDLPIKARSNMLETIRHFPYNKSLSQAMMEKIISEEYEQEQKIYNRQNFLTADGEGVRAIYIGKRSRHTVQMLIYDKRYDKNNAHDFRKFKTVDFYRWEYRIGRETNKLAGLYDLAYLDKRNVNNLWNIAYNRYMPLWGVRKGSLEAMEARKQPVEFHKEKKDKRWKRLPTVAGHLKAMDSDLLDAVSKMIKVLRERNNTILVEYQDKTTTTRKTDWEKQLEELFKVESLK